MEGTAKTPVIESILLGIPSPPIFVSQRDDGVWDVIDGVQRLSTVLEFTGNYVDEDGTRQPGFALEAGEYLTEMAGFTYVEENDLSLADPEGATQPSWRNAELGHKV